MMHRSLKAVAVALAAGSVEASPVEVVVSHFNENLDWLSKLTSAEEKPRVSIYTKGQQPLHELESKMDVHQLPNVGREAHTYLNHIVKNFDNLADWTIFTQAGEPSFGYKGHQEGGGHLMAGDSFANYMTPDPSGARFVHTSGIHLPSMNHVLRAAFCINDKSVEGGVTECPKEASQWTAWWDMGHFYDFVKSKVESQGGEEALDFYRKYINPAHSGKDLTLSFAQGARFAVSRDKILSRPKEDYERLLAALAKDVDPYAGYFMEWMWSELFLGHQEPCTTPALPKAGAISHDKALAELANRYALIVKQQPAAARFLQTSVSGGISGGISGGTTAAPSASTDGAHGQQVGLAVLALLALVVQA
jgi:hypothetical protein